MQELIGKKAEYLPKKSTEEWKSKTAENLKKRGPAVKLKRNKKEAGKFAQGLKGQMPGQWRMRRAGEKGREKKPLGRRNQELE